MIEALSVADLRRHILNAPSSLDPIFFIFMQYLGNLSNNKLVFSPLGLLPQSMKILDLALIL